MPRLLLLLALPLFAACVVPNEEAPATFTSWTLEPTTIAAGGTALSHLELADFELTGDDADHQHDAGDGSTTDGHHGQVQIYLDSLDGGLLLVQDAHEATLTLPNDATSGAHSLVARLHDAGGRALDPEVVSTLDIQVPTP